MDLNFACILKCRTVHTRINLLQFLIINRNRCLWKAWPANSKSFSGVSVRAFNFHVFSRVTSILKTRKKLCKMRRMSTQERARAVGLVQAGRSLREVCIYWRHWLSFITIFTLTVFKINKANLKSLQLLQVARDFNTRPQNYFRTCPEIPKNRKCRGPAANT